MDDPIWAATGTPLGVLFGAGALTPILGIGAEASREDALSQAWSTLAARAGFLANWSSARSLSQRRAVSASLWP